MSNLSRIQNQSLYTRRFNVLKKRIRETYDQNVKTDDTVAVRFGPEECIIAHDGDYGFTLHFYDESGVFIQSVQLVKSCGRFYTGLIGIHVHETDLQHIQDVIDSALKDGFKSIYIHSINKVG
jgi:hypothetical protein